MRRISVLCAAVGMAAAVGLGMQAMAQNGPPGAATQRAGGQGDQARPPRGPASGFHLLPRFVSEQLKLSEDQVKQLAALEAETKAKIEKILTPEQKKILEEARPPRPGERGGPGGKGGPGGPGGQGAGGPDDGPPPQ